MVHTPSLQRLSQFTRFLTQPKKVTPPPFPPQFFFILNKIIPKCDLSSLRSSPFESRNASRDTSYHGPGGGRSISKSGLATYKEDAEGWAPEINHVNDGGRGDGEDDGASSMSASTSGRSLTSNAADTAAAAAAAMVAAWTGSNSAEVKERKSASAAMAGAKVVSSEAEALPTTAAATVVNTGATAEVAASSDNSVADPTPTPPTAAPTEDGNREEVPPPSPKLVLSIPSEDGGWGEIGGEARRAPAVSDGGLDPTAEGTFVAPAEESGVGKKRDRRRGRSGSKDEAAAVAATATMAVVDGIGAGSGGATQKRPSLGEGVVADPTSHQHKRPVSSSTYACSSCGLGLRLRCDIFRWFGEGLGVCGVCGECRFFMEFFVRFFFFFFFVRDSQNYSHVSSKKKAAAALTDEKKCLEGREEEIRGIQEKKGNRNNKIDISGKRFQCDRSV